MSFDKEKAKRNIECILEKAYGDTDVNSLKELKEYRKLFKKEVSLFRRSWAAAWLLMYYDNRETPSEKRASASGSRSLNPKTNAREERTEERNAVVEIAEDESKNIFISIGKNRRLFPRDVITLIMTKANASREDIGVIKILDNYSFVQVRDKKADDIIASLNGHRFRGRTLAVNYAKPKTEAPNDTE